MAILFKKMHVLAQLLQLMLPLLHSAAAAGTKIQSASIEVPEKQQKHPAQYSNTDGFGLSFVANAVLAALGSG